MVKVTLRFMLPFSLDVDGIFPLIASEERFSVELNTVDNQNPNFPGASHLENVAIVNDATGIIARTNVAATYTPRDKSSVTWEGYCWTVTPLAVSVANSLINAARVAHGEYFKDFIYHPKQLGPIQYQVTPLDGTKGFGGVFDPLMGGIQPRAPARIGADTAEFAAVLATGQSSPIWRELMFDARRYKLSGNVRMAVANLVLGFEIGLSDLLAQVALKQGGTSTQLEIEQATIGKLLQKLSALTLGHSLEKVSYWGADTVRRCALMRETRNKVLHRAKLSVVVDGVTCDFSKPADLDSLFAEFDLLWDTLSKATDNVLSGRSAL